LERRRTIRKELILFSARFSAENPNRMFLFLNWQMEKLNFRLYAAVRRRPFLISVDFPGEAALEKS
jgi:hypothetical protein